jgi:hypothetical protein
MNLPRMRGWVGKGAPRNGEIIRIAYHPLRPFILRGAPPTPPPLAGEGREGARLGMTV